MSDIKGASVEVIVEYFDLWDVLGQVVLEPEVEDSHIWCLSTSGKYCAKSAYEGMFVGAIPFRPRERDLEVMGSRKKSFFHVVGGS